YYTTFNLVYSIFVIFMLFPVYFCKRKAEAARSEQEDIGTPELEALFASSEGVKWPTVLAAGAGYY
uniref:hypothetical protein n=1 Tax=Bacillus subtilis TaxID=1423 RepID=UPI0011A43082